MLADLSPSVGTKDALAALLRTADRRTLAATVVHLAGDPAAVSDVRKVELLLEEAVDVIWPYLFEGRSAPDPTDEVLHAAMELAAAEPVDPAYRSVAREQMGVGPRPEAPPLPAAPWLSVAIIGAGMAGILAASTFRSLGVAPSQIALFEKSEGPGGTWRQNTYPGCRVDTPSILYTYSFTPDYLWPEHFSRQPELLKYLEGIVEQNALGESIDYRTTVESVTWDEQNAEWQLSLRGPEGSSRTHRAAVLISAAGLLRVPRHPDIPGLGTFGGDVMHSSQWDASTPLEGRRVALIGSGASANQIAPAVAPVVDELLVFQRSPSWIMSHPQYGKQIAGDERMLIESIPGYRSWYRFRQFWVLGDRGHAMLKIDPEWPHPERAMNQSSDRFRAMLTEYLHSELADREDLISKTLPDYPVFAKRMVIDNGWFEALRRDNVSLITAPITSIDKTGIATSEGHQDVDVIILATGFQADQVMGGIDIVGDNGANVRKRLDDAPEAYLGMAVEDCPNFFVLPGPNGIPGHGGSAVFYAECQVGYLVEVIRYALEHGHRTFRVRREAVDDFVQETVRLLDEMVWANSNVTNWYQGTRDRVTAISPRRIVDLWETTRVVDPSAYTWS